MRPACQRSLGTEVRKTRMSHKKCVAQPPRLWRFWGRVPEDTADGGCATRAVARDSHSLHSAEVLPESFFSSPSGDRMVSRLQAVFLFACLRARRVGEPTPIRRLKAELRTTAVGGDKTRGQRSLHRLGYHLLDCRPATLPSGNTGKPRNHGRLGDCVQNRVATRQHWMTSCVRRRS